MNSSAERGNILFLILLAVVLFAALSYAVTSSMRGGGKDASSESLKANVAVVQNYGMQVRSALQRMQLIGGYPLWQIDYSKANISSAGANGSCTSTACQLFDQGGGGVTDISLPRIARKTDTAACSGNAVTWAPLVWFRNVAVKGIGVDSKRDLFLLHAGVNRDFYIAANEANGVANPSGEPPVDFQDDDSGCGIVDFGGTLTSDAAIVDSCVEMGVAEPTIAGKQMFCTSLSSDCYHLWTLLAER